LLGDFLPVGETVYFGVSVLPSMSVAAGVSGEMSSTSMSQLEASIEYKDGEWSPNAKHTDNNTISLGSWSSNAGVSFMFQIEPQASVQLFPLNRHLANGGVWLLPAFTSRVNYQAFSGDHPSVECTYDLMSTFDVDAELSVLDKKVATFQKGLYYSSLCPPGLICPACPGF
jgi:hypothetical protein